MNNNSTILLEVGVKVFLLNTDKKFLILKRVHPYHGQKIKKWDIPGGRIIPGENQLTALKRELQEETSLTITNELRIITIQDILRVPGKHTIRITYLATCQSSPKIRLNPKEHEQYRWVTLKELQHTRYDTYLNGPIRKLENEREE